MVAIEVEYGGEWGAVGRGVRGEEASTNNGDDDEYAGGLRDTVRGGERVGRTGQAAWTLREGVYQVIPATDIQLVFC